ncbi:MAG: M20/M25/M40 family metallo-hydrolase [Sphingobacteriales bacterium]|nr:MAG: M20/M25/M40 family metallo-hydrolase [Sphingobacteriales bacterium]
MTEPSIDTLFTKALALLQRLIATPSFSKSEEGTAEHIAAFLESESISWQRDKNNVFARSKHWKEAAPVYLLNSHHDTVKPAAGYTRNPFEPAIENGRLYGLGSNDAGGPLVALIATFLYFYNREDLPFNLVLAATAEEEISGRNGIEALLPLLPRMDGALVGEPTQMQLAVAERGLLVIDAVAEGRAGHAARKEGDNALYRALRDILWLQELCFDRVSPLLGPVTAQATVMETANKQHNVVPAECSFVIDVRVNELYTLEEVVVILQEKMESRLTPRSLRLRSSVINDDHPLLKAGKAIGRTAYGSPTTSDKALMPFPALKIGPGDSARSHTADEWIGLDELKEGIQLYIKLLKQVQ